LFERENSHQAECIAQKRTTVDMLALVVLHFVVFVLILPKNKHVKLINEGIWLIKIFFIALFTVLA
jgi:predicted tellurium resistance membrane protein TerC